ncbi:MAG: hypothetical protein AAF570_23800, partial [Bacteroidota bacterium]
MRSINTLALLTALFFIYLEGFAQGNAPVSPEFSSFAPTGTAKNVDPFTGGFSYSLPVLQVPGPHGAGYVLNLGYASGAGPQQEASWVGHGWTLNPGAITRTKRGFADDWKGAPVLNLNKTPSSETFTVYADVGLEAYGIGVNGMAGFRFNTLSGGAPFYSIGGSLFRGLNATYGSDAGRKSFNISLDMWGAVDGMRGLSERLNQNTATGRAPALTKSDVRFKSPSVKVGTPAFFNTAEFSRNLPSAFSRSYQGGGFGFKAAVAGDFSIVPVGVSGGIFGQYEKTDFIPRSPREAYGYLYSGDCPPGAAMDFFFENDHPYDYRRTKLPIPFSNADIFYASGKAIGGSFRLHQLKTGSFRATGGTGYVIPGNVAGQ